MQNITLKKDSPLTSKSFQRFLGWLDGGANSDGEAYLEMRRRLADYFDRKNCQFPDELADETINRVARRLEEADAGETEVPAKYCYITARYVFLEHLRERAKDQRLRSELPQDCADGRQDQSEQEARERTLECLDLCADKLDPASKELILRYYFGKERVKIESRQALARSLGISTNALSIRACRIRDRLELCVRECARHGDETIS